MGDAIASFTCGPISTNTYILRDPKSKRALIIDPAADSAPLIEEFVTSRGLVVEGILLTHSHWDHIVDCAALVRKYQLPVWVHSADARNMEEPGSDGLPLMFSIEGVEVSHFLEEGQRIELGSIELEVLHTPGHSPGSVCFYCAALKVLFSGDLIFKGAIGNLGLATAEPPRMWESLKKVARLPAETQVYAGHGEPTTLGAEGWLGRAKELFNPG